MLITEVFKKYNSNHSGLSLAQIEKNRKQYGTNELKKEKKKTFLVRFLLQFKNLMVLVLLFSAIVSLITNFFEPGGGSIFEAVIIFIIVVLNALIGVFQERKAENAIELLQKQTMPTATVIREGEIYEIKTSDLVCGDIVIIKSGNIVPADIALIESTDLKCNESSLTGESVPVDKDASTNLSEDKTNICYSGTIVTNGHAKGVAFAVGENSQLGKIASLITKTKKAKTPLEKNIDQISKVITIVVASIVGIVFLLNLFSNKLGFLDSFLTAIALAVAAIPESLPAVITIIMALGVEKLAKQGAIIKNLNSVETLGCCNILCSDKTGTLTQNNMQVQSVYFSGKIYNTEKIDNEIVQICLSLSSNVEESKDGLIGDPTETCIYKYIKSQTDIQTIKQSQTKIAELPFNSKTKTMSSLHKIKGRQILIVKGAFDYLIKNCSSVIVNAKETKLTEKLKTELEKSHFALASKGQRVIAYAYKYTNNINDNKLCLVCLIGIIDPPRKESKQAIIKLKKAHIKPIMITGDHPDTAYAIAKELGIANKRNETITGEELNNIDDQALLKAINNYSVFARVTPQDKTRIVKMLKSTNNIVAMTGDGANDAPSIKEADIGIAMSSGSDVTKNVSDVVITNNSILGIVSAVEQGRTIYSNLRKTLQFLISTNIVEVLCIFIISLVIPNGVFLLPAQILFINLITDSLPAFALGLERPEKEIMNKLPRKCGENLFSDELGSHIIAQGFVQSLIVLVIFVFCYNTYGNIQASTICFLIICYMQIIHAINCKTNKSIFTINLFNNKVFNFSFVLLFICITAVATVPSLQLLFGIAPLSISGWLIVSGASISIIPIVEITKLIINWFHRK